MPWWLEQPGDLLEHEPSPSVPDEIAQWAVTADFGSAILTPFGLLNPAELSDAGRVDALIALERLRSWTDAQQARLYGAMSVPAGEIATGPSRRHDPRADAADQVEIDKQWVRDEIACALRLSPGTVKARLHEGAELVHRLPDTLAALQAGTISHRHAAWLVDAVTHLNDDIVTAVEAQVLPRAGGQTPAAFRRCVRRAVLKADPADAEARHRRSLTDRRVCSRDIGDGMGELWALLPLDGIVAIMTALHADAAKPAAPGDDRTADQRRADALIALATLKLHDPALPDWHGRRPSVQIVVNATTLLGLDDDPADLDGYGPIPASTARAIAADPTGTWRRILTDQAGRLIDASRTYRPPAALANYIRARDQHCRFPGCPRTARRCELDHQHPWETGGDTTLDNLQCLCPRHHHLKHEAGWTVTGNPAGTLIWTSPTGHTYRAPPETYE